MPPVVEAIAALRADGNDVETCASLLLNGAAALVLERYTEEEFGQLARQMWRTAARQVDLLALLDRVTKRREFRVKPKRAAAPKRALEMKCPAQRTLSEGETS